VQTQAIDFQTGLSNAWSNVATFVPKLIAFLVILVIGYFVAKIVAKILTKVLQKVGFDRLVERGGVKRALARSEYDAAGILAQIVFYAIMLFVLSAAFGVFGNNPISGYLHAIVAYLPLVFVAILIVVIAAAIGAAVKSLIENSLGGLSYGRLLGNLAAGFILALGIIAALDQLHIAARIVDAVLYAALAAIVGVVIVAVGGGGIRAMSQRWDNVMARYDEEKPRMRQALTSGPEARYQAEHAARTSYPRESEGPGASTPENAF
jgi:Flp pilus assembly pilin Flp